MGYNTIFDGKIEITPILNNTEITFLKKFANSRHFNSGKSEFKLYFDGPFISPIPKGYNIQHPNKPSFWCGFIPTDDGNYIIWDGAEKTYAAVEWITYLIDTFLKPDARVKDNDFFKEFTFDHICSGVILAQGENIKDRYKIIVNNNTVTRRNLE